jgi:hypothetical protein
MEHLYSNELDRYAMIALNIEWEEVDTTGAILYSPGGPDLKYKKPQSPQPASRYDLNQVFYKCT